MKRDDTIFPLLPTQIVDFFILIACYGRITPSVFYVADFKDVSSLNFLRVQPISNSLILPTLTCLIMKIFVMNGITYSYTLSFKARSIIVFCLASSKEQRQITMGTALQGTVQFHVGNILITVMQTTVVSPASVTTILASQDTA